MRTDDLRLRVAEGVLRGALKDCAANAASGVYVDAGTIRTAHDAVLDNRDARALLEEALGSMSAAIEQGEVVGNLAEGSLATSCQRIREWLCPETA